MPKGSAVEKVERKLKAEYGGNTHAVYGTLNKIGLMRGNKATAKGLKPARVAQPAQHKKRMKMMNRVAKKAAGRYV